MSEPLTDEQALAVMVSVADELKAKAERVRKELGATYNIWSKLKSIQAKLDAAEAEAGCSLIDLTDRREALTAELAKLQASHAGQLQACRDWKAGIKRAQASPSECQIRCG